MEFNEKLQELRKRKGLTQEQLANALYVSRTAVSKWESGRGYPNMESLKALAKFFDVSIDELLSGEEPLTAAQKEAGVRKSRTFDRVFGLLDCSCVLFFFLPLLGVSGEGSVRAVSLLLAEPPLYLKAAYILAVLTIVGIGLVNLLGGSRRGLSLVFNGAGAMLFIISRQPYPAAVLFLYLVIKVLLLIKRQ